MLRAIATVGTWTMASRILGFVRDMLIAARLGAGPVADAFFVALKLPNLFRRLFGEGAFNAAFVPAFAGTLAAEGRAKAQALAERMASLLSLWLALIVLAGLLLMDWVIAAIAPGFLNDSERYALAVEMTRITFPYLWLICLAALVSGVLNGLDRFAAAAAAPVLFNLLLMAALLGLTPYVATPGHALSWGVFAAGAAQLALVWIAARQAGMALNLFRRPAFPPEVVVILKRMVPGVLGAGVTQLNLAIDVIIASLLPAGAVSFLYYADRVAQLPLGVVGAAIGTAMLPLLAKQIRLGQPLAAHRTQNRAIEVAIALSLPAAAALAVAATPIIAALFERGAFGAEATAASAAALAAYAAGLPAFVLVKALAPGYFARGDLSTPVKIGLVTVALNLALNLALAPVIGHVGIALATSLAAWANAAMLALVLRRRGRWRPDRRLLRALPRLAASAAVMAAGIALLLWLVPVPAGTLARVALVGGVVALGLALYFGTAQANGGFDLRQLARLRRRAA
jgi:putative peptidoglycan lipid II flippase